MKLYLTYQTRSTGFGKFKSLNFSDNHYAKSIKITYQLKNSPSRFNPNISLTKLVKLDLLGVNKKQIMLNCQLAQPSGWAAMLRLISIIMRATGDVCTPESLLHGIRVVSHYFQVRLQQINANNFKTLNCGPSTTQP